MLLVRTPTMAFGLSLRKALEEVAKRTPFSVRRTAEPGDLGPGEASEVLTLTTAEAAPVHTALLAMLNQVLGDGPRASHRVNGSRARRIWGRQDPESRRLFQLPCCFVDAL